MGIANIAEVANVSGGSSAGQQPDLRLIGSIHPLRAGFFVRKDSGLKTVADLRGKRVCRSDIPYHSGALRYFKDKGFQPKVAQ